MYDPGQSCASVELLVYYHSGNVVACGEMKGRGKTDRMQIACRCRNGNEMNGRGGVSARLIEIQ